MKNYLLKTAKSKLVLLAALFIVAVSHVELNAQATHLVISQVYGGGGNSGSVYTHDFIEIFNPSSSAINLSGHSVQYASSAGSSWQVTALPPFNLQPGQYFLIRQNAGSGGTTPLPTPDATGSISMSATAGKVALVSVTTALSGTCPTANVVDFVGFGTTANCFEGSGPTPAPSNTNAVLRAANGCTETNNNSANFSAGLPNPRNTSSLLNPCSVPSTPTITSFSPASACSSSGESVVITGTNFVSVIDITFNGTSAAFVVNSTTQITATLPASATTGTIQVTTGSGSATSSTSLTVNPIPAAVTVVGGGVFCGSTTISASGGAGGTIYFQGTSSGGTDNSNASTSEIISATGTYYFRSQSFNGCWGPQGSTSVTINSAFTPSTIFIETMGTVSSTTSIAAHEAANGFDNVPYTMSGTADIRATAASSGYVGSSGSANVFMTNNGTANFQIAGINTLGYQEFSMSFGIFKSTIASNGSELVVAVSPDGVNYTPLSFPALPTGSGTAIWHYRTATGSIPATANLRIRFTNTSTSPQFRIDDITLTGANPSSTLTANGPTTFCPGGSVILTAPNAASYLWSNNETTQSITVNSSGTYSSQLTFPNSCVAVSNSITVSVEAAPSFTSCPSNISQGTSPVSCNAAVSYSVVASGSPSPTLMYSFTGATSGSGSGDGSGSIFNVGTTTVTVTATNSCGSDVCTFNVVVSDNTPPVAICQSVTVTLDATGNGSITASQVDNGSNDACGIASMSVSPNIFSCADLDAGASPTDLFISEYIEGTSNNKCIEIFNGTGAAVNLATGGYQLRFYFNGSSSAGNTINLTGTVAAGDVYVVCQSAAASNFLAQADQTNGSSWYNGNDAVVLSKGFGATTIDIFGRIGENPGAAWGVAPLTTIDKTLRRNNTVTTGIAVNPFSGFPTLASEWTSYPVNDDSGLGSHSFATGTGIVPVTLTVVDNNGNSSTCIANVTVVDLVPPTVVCQNIDVYLDATGNATITGFQVDNGSSDACGIASMSVSPSSFTCADIGPNTVVLTVTDLQGNSATCNATVTVIDNVAPVAICQNLTVMLDANGNGSLTAAQVNNGSTDNCGIASISISPNTFDCSNIGAAILPTDLFISEYIEGSSNNKCIEIYNGTGSPIDLGAGGYQLRLYFNGSTSSSNINLSGVIASGDVFVICNSSSAPAFLAVADQTSGSVSFNGNDAVVLYKGSTAQNLDIFGTIGENPGTTWGSGMLQTLDRTLRRKASIVSGVTVNPAPGFPTLSTEWDGYATNDLANLGLHSIASGPNVVTLTVTDNSGNTSTCFASVTVIDNIPPTINCPSDINVFNDPGLCGAMVTYSVPVGIDNCSSTTIQTAGLSSGSVFPVGTTTNSFLVTDGSGNFASCSFMVTVIDNELPMIVNVPASFSSCNPVTWTPPAISDNCPGVQITSTHTPGSVFPSGTTTVTYTATDAYGQQASASFDVTILDPSIAADNITSNRDYNNICVGENIMLTLNGGMLGAGASWNWYSGSCGGTPVASGVTSITVAPTSTTTYFARAEGVCGNSACVQINVVVSTSAPTATPTYTNIPDFGAPGLVDTIEVAPVLGATYYYWFTNNGQINGVLFNGGLSPQATSIPEVQITFVQSQQNYQIRVRAGNACGISGQRNTTIRGTVASPTSLSGPTQVCPGQSHDYTVSAIASQSGNSPVGYNWELIPSSAGTISGSGLTRTVNFAPGFTSAQLCVNGISSFGLHGPSYCISISTSSPAPGLVSGPSSVCEGGVGNYSIAAVPGATGYTWSSTIGAIVVGSGTSASVTFPSGSFSGDVCVVSESACGTSTPSCITVSSGTAGTPGPISGPVLGICEASNVNYSLGTSDANSYNWIVPAGVTLASANGSNSINLNFGAGFTNGTISVEAFYDCGSNTSSISVSGEPIAPTVSPAIICAGTTELYFASSTGAVSYNWILSGNNTSFCTNPPVCSQYYVEWSGLGGTMSVTATNNCGTSVPFNLSTNCRIADGGTFETNVYPNPTSGLVNVEFVSNSHSKYTITITDMLGRVILLEALQTTPGLNEATLDLNFAEAGVYMMYIKNANGNNSVTKIVVE